MQSSPPAAVRSLRRRTVSTRIGASTGAGVAALAVGYALLVSVPHPVATTALALVMLVPGALIALFAGRLAASRLWPWVTGGYLAVTVPTLLGLIALQETVASPLTFFMIGPLFWVAMTRPSGELVSFCTVFVAVYVTVAVFGDAGPLGYPISNLGAILAVVAACSVRRAAMERDQEAVRWLSWTDPLTGSLNRRGFEDLLTQALANGSPFTLAAFDLDGLKHVNDTQGHDAGDELLRAAAEAITRAAGAGAVVGRIGGDEFAALIPGDNASEQLAEGVPGVSFGVASFPADAATADALLALADYSLYEAKRRGTPVPLVSLDGLGAAALAREARDDVAADDGPATLSEPRSGASGGVRLAALLHLAGFASMSVYGVATLGSPGHLEIGIVGAAGALAALIAAARAEVLRRSSIARMTYTAVAFSTTFVALTLDGGPGQPLASGFLLPVMAVAMTARPRDLAMLGSGLVLGFAGVMALTDFGPPGYTPIMLIVTALAAGACCAQQSEMVRQRRRLDGLSCSDALTGCLNRRGMRERLARMEATPGTRIALLSIDLDDFKSVNDTFGHAAGDDLLRWVGKTITECVRPGDAVGRMGGDEFCVLIPAPFSEAPAVVATLVANTLRHRTSASIGCAVYPDEVGDLWSLKTLADDRMYEAKRAEASVRGGAQRGLLR